MLSSLASITAHSKGGDSTFLGSITVYNTGAIVAECTIKISLPRHDRLRADFNDVCFKDSGVLLKHWVASVASNVATVWVKVPDAYNGKSISYHCGGYLGDAENGVFSIYVNCKTTGWGYAAKNWTAIPNTVWVETSGWRAGSYGGFISPPLNKTSNFVVDVNILVYDIRSSPVFAVYDNATKKGYQVLVLIGPSSDSTGVIKEWNNGNSSVYFSRKDSTYYNTIHVETNYMLVVELDKMHVFADNQLVNSYQKPDGTALFSSTAELRVILSGQYYNFHTFAYCSVYGFNTKITSSMQDLSYTGYITLHNTGPIVSECSILVNLPLPSNNRLRSDFKDVIFFKNNVLSNLFFWIESVTNNVARIWVKVPSLANNDILYFKGRGSIYRTFMNQPTGGGLRFFFSPVSTIPSCTRYSSKGTVQIDNTNGWYVGGINATVTKWGYNMLQTDGSLMMWPVTNITLELKMMSYNDAAAAFVSIVDGKAGDSMVQMASWKGYDVWFTTDTSNTNTTGTVTTFFNGQRMDTTGNSTYMTRNVWYTVKIVLLQDQIVTLLDGNQVASYASPTNLFDSNAELRICLSGLNNYTYFKEMKVYNSTMYVPEHVSSDVTLV